jgi:NAD(P)-dependent dehydrogenase (short-subunit alcohol dehydrogenase family)
MHHPRVFIIAASADIGAHLAAHFLKAGCEVVGTYRHRTDRVTELEQAGAVLFQADLNCRDEVAGLAEKLRQSGYEWDVLISAVGLLSPIGPFFSTDFEQWEESVVTNSTSQLRMLHAVAPLRSRKALSKVIFFAGGGTNGPFDNYSAYCLGKLSLIKMTELLDSEYQDLQVSIIGTGWVNTKIHQQTIEAGLAAGVNFSRTQEFMAGNTGSAGAASLDDVAECIEWCLGAPRAAVGGRNFSLGHDQWRDPGFVDMLINNPGSYKLRRLS